MSRGEVLRAVEEVTARADPWTRGGWERFREAVNRKRGVVRWDATFECEGWKGRFGSACVLVDVIGLLYKGEKA